MRPALIPLLIVVSALISGTAGADIPGRAGTTAMAFLKIGAGARYAAMADVGAALADDAYAVFWNPARLSEMYGSQALGFQHHVWIAGITLDEAYYAYRWRKHRLGLSARLLATDDIPLRGDLPTEEPIAYFRAYNFFGGASYAFVPDRHLSLGFSYRRLYEKIYLDAAYGHSLQAGLNLNLIDPDVSLSATADNFGTRIHYRAAYYHKQPTAFSVGTSWRPGWSYRQIGACLAAVAVRAIDDRWQWRLGGEIKWRGLLTLRAGYKAGHSTEGLAAGLGLAWRRWQADYAFVPHRYDLGTSHRISLSLGF